MIMKKYIGTKTVKATPMSMGEAYERKLLKEGIRPSECETDKAGYLVEYEDGYQSWSPAEPFEKSYRIADTPFDRMAIEYDEESMRYQKGDDFLRSETFAHLKYLPKVLLSAQNETQREYCYLLADRKDQMSNKLVLPTNYDFGTAVKLLKAGGAVRRAGWNGKGMFVVKQVPAHITSAIIPNMQSLPQIAKDILMKRKNQCIDYTNQMLIIHPDGRADSWVPSSSDVFAEDWELVTE
jgi:hypothetical protein